MEQLQETGRRVTKRMEEADVQVTTWGSQAVMATYCGTPSRGRLDKAELGDSEDEGPGDGGGGTVSAQRSFRAMTGLCLIP